MKHTAATAILLVMAHMCATGADNGSAAAGRMMAFDTAYAAVAAPALANPALAAERHTVSNTGISVGYSRLRLHHAPAAAMGKGNASAFFDAKTYMKQSKAVITGHASYQNGKIFDMQACETSDADILFPYFSADDKCGDQKAETYSFGGSYSSTTDGKWIYGATLDYTARQAWRQVDPRPKNTAGLLNIGAAFGRRIDKYALALGIDAMKYSQSSSIKFVSQLGANKIYHTTGLGSDYNRFAGTGLSSHYSGWRYGADISASALGNGAFGMAAYHRFTFDKQLNDLNRLPMNRAAHTDWQAQAGWRQDHFIAAINFGRRRRTGFDNIFGDAAGQVYPQIASIATYFMRRWHVGVDGTWRHTGSRHRLDAGAAIGYSHNFEAYISAPDDRRLRADALSYRLNVQWLCQLTGTIMLGIDGRADITSPGRTSLAGIGDDSFMAQAVAADFDYARHSRSYFTAGISVDRLLPRGRAIGLRLAGTLAHALGGGNGSGFAAAASFSF